ncbi:MAG TPA: alpha/beta hydrolase [Vicinamibacterales bacterium]|nr:alpha/beta hydrolase [Vicinamibacterales bacterium]
MRTSFQTVLLLVAVTLAFCAMWIVVPAPNLTLLAFGVGAPEVSPFLLVASLVTMLVAWRGRRGTLARSTLVLSVAAFALSAWPLAHLPFTIREFDQQLPPSAAVTRSAFHVRDFFSGIAAGDVRVVRDVPFAAPANQPLRLDIYRPMAAGRYPVLVQIYGGAWQRGQPGDNAAFAQYFAGRGYVVFALDYRKAPQWKWPAQRDDVRAGLSWVREHAGEYDADASRMALIGRSAGAQLALIAAYQREPGVAGVVSYYGPADLAEGWRTPPRPDPLNVRSVLEAYLGGTPDVVADQYRDASPTSYVLSTLPPTLLIYGARDHIVEARFGRDLHQRLQSAGASSILLEIPWAEHAFDALPAGVSGQLALLYTDRFLSRIFR